jgi:hypothetical protein
VAAVSGSRPRRNSIVHVVNSCWQARGLRSDSCRTCRCIDEQGRPCCREASGGSMAASVCWLLLKLSTTVQASGLFAQLHASDRLPGQCRLAVCISVAVCVGHNKHSCWWKCKLEQIYAALTESIPPQKLSSSRAWHKSQNRVSRLQRYDWLDLTYHKVQRLRLKSCRTGHASRRWERRCIGGVAS